jgi:hypothetical protein
MRGNLSESQRGCHPRHGRSDSAVRWSGLALADALFLWMLASVAGADALARDVMSSGDVVLADALRKFAADWRHGMTGHSPIYMPGFFALTIATWCWHRERPPSRLLTEGALAMAAGLALASIGQPAGRAIAEGPVARQFHVALPLGATSSAMAVGVLTATCWTVLVLAVWNAVTRNSLRLLAAVPVLYGVLGGIRGWWSIEHLRRGDDIGRASARLLHADPVALASLLAILWLAFALARARRRRRPG